MTKLYYFDTREIGLEEISKYLDLLPIFFKNEVLKYKYLANQRLCLFARLMLLQSLKDDGVAHLVDNWYRDVNHKPFIRDWKYFSIAHSESLVAFAYSSNLIGLDIEINSNISYEDLICYLHPEEQRFLSNKNLHRNLFYQIWVRKEALLKAIGVGLGDGLHKFNCLYNSVSYQDIEWFFHPVLLDFGYTCFLCSSDKCEVIENVEFIAPTIN